MKCGVVLYNWSADAAVALEGVVIAAGMSLTLLRPALQVGKLYEEYRRLKSVKTGIVADDFVVVGHSRSMNSQHTAPLVFLFSLHRDNSGITTSAEILGGIERETAVVADGAEFSSFEFGANTLRGVFYNFQIVFFCDGHDGIHVGRLPKEMHRHDRLCFGSDGGLDFIG